MGLKSLRGTFLRGFFLLSLCLSLIVVYKVLYFDDPTSLTASSLNIGRLGDILRQGTDAVKSWPFSAPPTTPHSTDTAEDANEMSLPHLQKLCNDTIWRPDLSLRCHSHCGPDKSSFCGGLNNARDRLQTCIRLAIDAGATTVLIPSIAARSESALWTIDPSAVTENVGKPVVLCPGAWFSLEQLEKMLGRACHQLKVEFVCPTENELPGSWQTPNARIVQMPWRPLGGDRYDIRLGHTFREAVNEALLHSPVGSGSVLVEYGDPYIAWNYTHGNEIYSVYKDLFRTIEYNHSLLTLGERIIQSPKLHNTSYVGVHLRGENDWPEEWGSLDEQTRLYADEIQRLGEQDDDVSTIYVSCGNQTSIKFFRQAVEPFGFSVLDKWMVFETDWPDGIAIVESLPFDQKAVVEYETLVAGKYFLGLSLSSMSVVVATTRTLDEPGDFLETYMDIADQEPEDKGRRLEIRGNNHTRLLSISGIVW